jgi:DDB1- and CUL4-associated factor 11
MSTGTCTTHSWNDGAEEDEADWGMGLRVNEQLQNHEDLFENSRLRNGRTSLFRAGLRSSQVSGRDNVDEEP